MSEHTPGTWSAYHDKEYIFIQKTSKYWQEVREIASVGYVGQPRGDYPNPSDLEEWDAFALADARLIAAAPDLLKIVSDIEAGHPLYSRARRILKKVEGGTIK